MRNCVIFDMDGTLANCDHRRYLVTGTNESKQFSVFHEELLGDTPITSVVNLYKTFHKLLPIIICTGRPAEYLWDTIEWLNKYSIPQPDRILMREYNSSRPDTNCKRQMLDIMRREGYNPILAIDDRNRVCDMWKENGIPVHQVVTREQGNF